MGQNRLDLTEVSLLGDEKAILKGLTGWVRWHVALLAIPKEGTQELNTNKQLPSDELIIV